MDDKQITKAHLNLEVQAQKDFLFSLGSSVFESDGGSSQIDKGEALQSTAHAGATQVPSSSVRFRGLHLFFLEEREEVLGNFSGGVNYFEQR